MERREDDKIQDYRLKVVEQRMEKMEESIKSSLKEIVLDVRLIVKEVQAENKERDKRVERLERELLVIKATAAAYGTAAGLLVTFIGWLIKQYGH